MKYLLYILLFLATSAASQSVVKDSSYLEQVDSVYYLSRYQRFDNGNIQITKTLMGNQTAAVEQTTGNIGGRISGIWSTGYQAAPLRDQLSGIITEDSAATVVLGTSPLGILQSQTVAPFLQDGWRLAGKPVTFTMADSGTIKYKIGNTTKNAVLFGPVIRLLNYAGEDTDFYQLQNGDYADLGRGYRLEAPSLLVVKASKDLIERPAAQKNTKTPPKPKKKK